MSRILHVPTRNIDDHWPRVRQGLERIIAKTAPDWMPEHVYLALVSGAANLLMVNEGESFVIWQRYPGDDLRGLFFVLAAEGEGLRRYGDEVHAELERLARASGCRKMRMMSPRKGWERLPFWRLSGYVYEHEVKP